MASAKEDYNAVPLTEKVDPEKSADANDGSEDENVGLKPKMTLLNGCTVIVGSIIGSGIFVSPSGVLEGTGSVNLALLVWIISGVFSMIGAYCYAELGCMIKKTGADYAYIMVTFGPFLAFIRLWVECIIVRPCSQAIVALTFSIYATKPFFPECDPPDTPVRLLAAMCICLLTFVNCWEVKWATFVQDIFTYAKLLALFIIILTGFYQLSQGKVENFTFENTEEDMTKIALSFYSGLFAYNGWNYLNFVIEELQDPVKNLPRAIAISCVLVTLVYVFTNIAFYTTLSVPEVLGSEAVAVTFAERMYGSWAFMIPIFVAMSTFGGVNGILLTSSRLFYAGACEGQMPEILSMIQVNKMTPAPAVLVVAFLSLIYLTSSNIFALINYTGFATWVSIGLAVFCLPYLRWKHPEWERPIKVSLIFPIIYCLATVYITIVPMIASPVETGIGIAIILTGVPVYFIFVYWKNKPQVIQKLSDGFTKLLMKLIVVLPPKKSGADTMPKAEEAPKINVDA
ncbi:Y+L amino acid transporter 2-like isoform X1 [Tigriopus californicus]|uniref:Y+L amino acid transporter 2-like isoform X1 n=1 Tax=Tigriopus californicus TaxID=6832 RepID=UPI0027D9ECDF|nr:Y+L amino acid transporter 2-like isoform X1 [Tigriopus californicus]